MEKTHNVMDTLWYKNAVIYSLDVRSFMDGNADGIGDFTGLISRLDYLSALGINCLWLLPFFPSPHRDAGYDISDYYSIDPHLGTPDDFVRLIREAERHDIRILIDLVVNHTSVSHPWFQDARSNPNSPYRGYYVWLPEKPPRDNEDIVFGPIQQSNWAFDKAAGAWYYHTFYDHQPDLNMANPEVQEEVKRIMKYWLSLGVSGFRMDAVPHMLRQKGNEQFIGDPHQVLRDFHVFVESCNPEAVLMAEADAPPEKYQEFFGNGDQIHMLLNFYITNYLFLALARQQATPLVQAMQRMLPAEIENQWQSANFLRNHDELDLERLTPQEREEVYARFGPEENMRLYGRGIRRRLPTMLRNHRRQIELAYSLLFSLPGTPVLRYGEEIGMGDELSLEERNSVRTIMQWSNARNAGFSAAPPEKLLWPALEDGDYGYRKVNVVDQLSEPGSLLNQITRMIHLRRRVRPFGFCWPEIIPVDNAAVMVHRCKTSNYEQAMAIHNFSSETTSVTLPLKDAETAQLVNVFTDEPFNSRYKTIELPPFGYAWFTWGAE